MCLRFHVLGSGSRGNAYLLESTDACVLIDAGFSGRQLERRLHAVGRSPEDLSALLITHEHRDHTRGMGVMARRWSVPIYITKATARSSAALLGGEETVHLYRVGEPLDLGDLRVEPFLTSHDAIDPVAVTVHQRRSGLKIGVATDLGTPTVSVRHALQACHLLVLEANHDDIMLRDGPYPWSVKSRIAGRHGHLSNRAAAQLGRELYHEGLAGVVLAHLSQECNEPELARGVVGDALGRLGFDAPIWVASQDDPIPGIDLPTLAERVLTPQLGLFEDAALGA